MGRGDNPTAWALRTAPRPPDFSTVTGRLAPCRYKVSRIGLTPAIGESAPDGLTPAARLLGIQLRGQRRRQFVQHRGGFPADGGQSELASRVADDFDVDLQPLRREAIEHAVRPFDQRDSV